MYPDDGLSLMYPDVAMGWQGRGLTPARPRQQTPVPGAKRTAVGTSITLPLSRRGFKVPLRHPRMKVPPLINCTPPSN